MAIGERFNPRTQRGSGRERQRGRGVKQASTKPVTSSKPTGGTTVANNPTTLTMPAGPQLEDSFNQEMLRRLSLLLAGRGGQPGVAGGAGIFQGPGGTVGATPPSFGPGLPAGPVQQPFNRALFDAAQSGRIRPFTRRF